VKRRVLFALALGLLFSSPGVASAEALSSSGYTYTSNSDCSWMSTTIRNDWARPHLDSVATMDWWGNGRNCGNTTAVAQRWAIAVRQDLVVWNWNSNQWEWCDIGPWVQNDWGPSHEVRTSFGWASPPCAWALPPGGGGSAFYAVGRSMTWNGAWHGANWVFNTNWLWA
jgi:hypothetical protein